MTIKTCLVVHFFLFVRVQDISSLKRIYIDQRIQNGIIAQTIVERAPDHIQIEWIKDVREVLDSYHNSGRSNEKEDLLVYHNPADWISGCPGSDGMVCCQYFVINFGLGCLFDCHYCYLQSFLNNPLMSIFGNLEDLLLEIKARTKNPAFHFRIGTGEYTDSLAIEPLTRYASHLVKYFAGHSNATLELKTKSVNIDGLLDIDHNKNTVIAWSINPQEIIDLVEDKTASLEMRLGAAKKASQAGYRLAFHLDPLIYYENWEFGYKNLIKMLFDFVEPDDIAWISIGSFRYSPGLKEVIQSRFPDDELTRKEMVQGADGKLRYFKTIREEMYIKVKSWIMDVDPSLFTYLCMETKRMWKAVYNNVPNSAKNLDTEFEKRRKYLQSVR